jgi:hypothetical protein
MLAIFVAGIVVGVVGGFMLGEKYLSSQVYISEAFGVAWVGERAAMLYHSGTEPEARCARRYRAGAPLNSKSVRHQ